MISLLLALGASIWLLASFKKDRAFLLVAIFLTWQFTLKVFGVVFLDIFGPIYSDEVGTEVGGEGASAPFMILLVMIPLMAMKLALQRASNRNPPLPEPHLARGGLTFADVAAGGFVVFLICLYGDMLRIGQIPLFEGLERFEYKGGIFHVLLVNYMFLVGHVIGFVMARGRLLSGIWDVRFGGIVFALFTYLFLTGHRFGSFYVLVSFALVPMAAVVFAPRLGMTVPRPPRRRSIIQRLASSRAVVGTFAAVLVCIVLVAMANSLLNVREGDAQDALLQRFLVQPVHLYWLTWERLQTGQVNDLAATAHFIFNDPFDATRNTGIQYLMMLHLGMERASQVYEGQEVDYAGGYPEILIELGGVWFAIAAALAASVLIALLYRLVVVAVCRGQFLLSVLAIYVCFGLLNLFLGGMVTFITTDTYWLKMAALAAVVLLNRPKRNHRRRFPWVLIPRRRAAPRTAPSPLLPTTPRSLERSA
jgi:hypothetical protein